METLGERPVWILIVERSTGGGPACLLVEVSRAHGGFQRWLLFMNGAGKRRGNSPGENIKKGAIYAGAIYAGVEVVDQNRVLVDAPKIVRSKMSSKRFPLTSIRIDTPRVPKGFDAMDAADVQKKWENSSWGRKLIIQKRRAELNDFELYKSCCLR